VVELAESWLVEETYVKILGEWHYLYRGVDLEAVAARRVCSRVRKGDSGRRAGS
jgi:transposase-like protein